jgi:hypothetical protein
LIQSSCTRGHAERGPLPAIRPPRRSASEGRARTVRRVRPDKTKPRHLAVTGFSISRAQRDTHVLGRPGSDLLSQALRLSTIGATGFNGRVRDGIGFWALCNYHQIGEKHAGEFWIFRPCIRCLSRSFRSSRSDLRALINENDQANRAISTSQLQASPLFHIWPINVVVFHGSQGNARFEGGFLLRCFQQLSRPNIATLQCGWRHNRSTRDSSNPVLSY